MEILLENKQKIEESVLNERNQVLYARIFEKMARYARQSNVAVNESRYYRGYNPNIFFNLDEREAVTDLLCTIRSHIYEAMNEELKRQLVTEGAFDIIRQKVSNAVDKTKQKVADIKDKVAEKFQGALKIVNELIKKGVSTVKELIEAFGKILLSLGDNLKTALEKLGAFKAVENKEDESTDSSFSKEVKAAEIPEKEQSFVEHVLQYIQLATESKKGPVAEGIMDTVGNNKAFQFIMSVSKDRKRWSFWHTLLVSLVGTFIITVVMPMLMMALGASASVIGIATTAVALVWSTRSLIRVIFNRWLSKGPEEKFWNWQTVLGVILSTVPIGLMQIPAVREWVIDGLTRGLEWLGVDKLVNNIEELLGRLVEKCGGTNWTQTTEITEVGKEVTKVIDSYVGKGDVHVDLFKGAGMKEYIAHLFGKGSHINDFHENTSLLKSWLTDIGTKQNFTSSSQMLNAMTGTLSGDAPLTAVIDGNTFGHVSRATLEKTIEDIASKLNIHAELINISNDALRTTTEGAAGTSFALVFDANATTDNVALANDFMAKVAQEMGLKASAGYDTFINIANQVKDSFTEFHTEEVVNVITSHSLFKTMMDCFNPIFNPFFKREKWGDYDIRPGSNTSGYKTYTVTDVKHLTLDEVAKLDPNNPALHVLVKHIQDVQRQHQLDIQAGIDQSKEEDGKISSKAKKVLQKQMEIFRKNSKIKERQLMVIYVSGTFKDGEGKEQKLENAPFVAMDMTTMYCADIMPWFPRRRKNIYPIMGLFARLDFMPKKKDDNDTKNFIYEMLNKFTDSAVKVMVEGGTGSSYVQIEDKKYVPSDPDKADESYFDTGGLSPKQICDVLNGTIEAYTLLDGRYAKNVRVTVDKQTGEIKKKSQKDNLKLIEKKRYKKEEVDGKVKFVEDKDGEYDYVDAKVVPFINKKLIDEIKKDKDVAELMLDKDQKSVNKDIIDDKQLNLKQWLFRPAKTFSKQDKYNLAEAINKHLKDESLEEKKEVYNTLKRFIEIVWRGIYTQYEKVHQSKNQKNSENQNESLTRKQNSKLIREDVSEDEVLGYYSYMQEVVENLFRDYNIQYSMEADYLEKEYSVEDETTYEIYIDGGYRMVYFDKVIINNMFDMMFSEEMNPKVTLRFSNHQFYIDYTYYISRDKWIDTDTHKEITSWNVRGSEVLEILVKVAKAFNSRTKYSSVDAFRAEEEY